MKWTQDKNFGAYAVDVPCLYCTEHGLQEGEKCVMVKLADAWIDTDGPAFQAYYHLGCKLKKEKQGDSELKE